MTKRGQDESVQWLEQAHRHGGRGREGTEAACAGSKVLSNLGTPHGSVLEQLQHKTGGRA